MPNKCIKFYIIFRLFAFKTSLANTGGITLMILLKLRETTLQHCPNQVGVLQQNSEVGSVGGPGVFLQSNGIE